MGRLSLGKKNTSTVDKQSSALQLQPNYCETRQSPLIDAGTATTRTEVVATSETTAHFLSFPGWRKRNHAVLPEPQNSPEFRTSESSGNRTKSPNPLPYSREKALPPTPAEPPAQEPIFLEGTTSTAQCASPTTHGQLPRSTSILAQAALGLGLPHVMPHASPRTAFPATEVNTVAFVTSTPHHSSDQPIPTLKRSKSSQKVGRPSLGTQLDANARGRTRGVSLGPSSFLSLGAGDSKGKEKEKERGMDSHPTAKSVSRRASFWMRKKSAPDGAVHRPSTAHGDFSRNRPSTEVGLPDTALPQTRDRELHACDPLSHSVSQRPQSHHPTRSHDVPRSPTDRKLLAPRPVTAESPSMTGGSNPWIDGPSTSSARVAAVSFSEHKPKEKSPNLRLRSQTNPPLLHRLSLNVFSSSSFFSTSPISSPISPLQSPAVDTVRSPVIIPRPMETEESPEAYLSRLEEIIDRVEVTSILASSPGSFYAAALKAFIGRFDFNGNPLDIALRKLLMEIGLPKETQQIDRVMEAFANRYMQCNPDLYASEDHPYILAFSLIMLHTDAFNKSNKHKMSKQDYIKNTKLPGVPPEILDYFYDNTIFAPFIFIEDPLDVSGQRSLMAESNRRSTTLREVAAMTTNNPSAGPTLTIKSNKIDPYYMITNDLLAPLRIDVEKYIPMTDPFSYQGTAGQWDEKELLLAFANAHVVEVGSDTARSTPFFGLTAGGSSSQLISASAGGGDTDYQEVPALRVTKAGVVHRKDDLVEGGKKAGSRKWRSWGVALTGSQLLFSRDPTWINALLSQTSSGNDQTLIPQSATFKVDEVLSVKNAVAVYDSSHTKHRHTFRLALSDGRHLLLKVTTEDVMNQWILRINYASAFKSAGVRMRLLGMSGKNMQLTGVAAATSHLHDIQSQIHSPLNEVAKWNDDAPRELLEMLSGDEPANKRPAIQRRVTLKGKEEVELELPTPLGAEETTEFKDTFDQVKADLAAETWKGLSGDSTAVSETDANSGGGGSSLELLSPVSSHSERSRLPSRSQMVQAKITEIEARLSTTENHLDAHMRLVCNIAILTPFQKTTRDRLAVVVQATSQRVMQLRLEIARLRCHRNILHDDMVAENRIWEEVKHIALQTAKETLQSRLTSEAPQMPSFGVLQGLVSRELETHHQRPESSTCESFHTAIDFGPDWPSSDDLGSTFFGTSWLLDSPRPSTSESLSSYVVPEVDGGSSRIWKIGPGLSTGSQTTSDSTLKGEEETDPRHERFYTAQDNLSEEAEAWHKTRCARRVSLVRVPSNIELSQFGRRLTAGQVVDGS